MVRGTIKGHQETQVWTSWGLLWLFCHVLSLCFNTHILKINIPSTPLVLMLVGRTIFFFFGHTPQLVGS